MKTSVKFLCALGTTAGLLGLLTADGLADVTRWGSGDCKALASGDSSYCTTDDCKGIVKADPKGIPVPADVPLDEKCPTCGKHFVKRHGRYGEFVCCVDYPTCKTVKKEILGVPCPTCGGGARSSSR